MHKAKHNVDFDIPKTIEKKWLIFNVWLADKDDLHTIQTKWTFKDLLDACDALTVYNMINEGE